MLTKLFKHTESSSMDQRIKELESENTELRRKIKEYTDANNTTTHSVDWAAMNVFSIERMFSHTHQRYGTIIGYWKDDPIDIGGELTYERKPKEWTLLCSVEEHERLVKEFNKYISTKEKK